MKTTDHRARRGAAARRILVAGLSLLAAVSAGAGLRARQGPAPAPVPRAEALGSLRALDDAAARGLWPGFSPAAVPLALFDGENTLLRGHPSPPAEFVPVPGQSRLLITRGRYPAVTANSTRDIGGVRTATVVPEPAASFGWNMLAVVEEAFHVFWLERHPAFRPDEMARYAYPLEDVGNLHALLAEDEALARAIEAASSSDAAAWAATALGLRRARIASLDEDLRTYESALEMMEGTANYVSRVAVGETPAQTAERLRRARPVDGIRWRFYDSGAALCFVLDRLSAGWKAAAEREPALTMVEQLRAALGERPANAASFSDAELSALLARASSAIAGFESRRAQVRASLIDRPGARIVISLAAGVEPFRIRRFDPVNLLVLRGGEVAHPHNLTIESAQGTVEVTNPGFVRGAFDGAVALSLPAGSHPLRSGVRELTLIGLSATPAIGNDPGEVRIDGPGVSIRLRNASVSTEGNVIRIEVKGTRP